MKVFVNDVRPFHLHVYYFGELSWDKPMRMNERLRPGMVQQGIIATESNDWESQAGEALLCGVGSR
jgi:hypothetical protein